MPPTLERAALVRLLRTGGASALDYADLVEEAGSAIAVLEAELAVGPGQLPGQTSLIDDQLDDVLSPVLDEIAAWRASGLELVTVLDQGYPDNLRMVHDRPPLIFVVGAITPADARAVAVIGARDASASGRATAASIAEHLVAERYTVVSGLAAGIDTAAHTASLAGGGRPIAVIGTGSRRFYPPQNEALQRRIASEGAVISQFWPDAPASRRSFPMRNAVMSGLALATVVVEASQTSGARQQARVALAHGRPVFLLEPVLAQPWARALATRPGVEVVGSPEEITQRVGRLSAPGALIA